MPDQLEVRLRHVGLRSLEKIPPTELASLIEFLLQRHHYEQEALMRATLDAIGLKYMALSVRETFLEIQTLLVHTD